MEGREYVGEVKIERQKERILYWKIGLWERENIKRRKGRKGRRKERKRKRKK